MAEKFFRFKAINPKIKDELKVKSLTVKRKFGGFLGELIAHQLTDWFKAW
jgi:hypothetical protein